MISNLEITDTLIGKLTSGISIKGTLQMNNILKGTIVVNNMLKGKLRLNNVPYYATSNEYGSTVYIG